MRSRIFDTCSGSWNRGFHEFSRIFAYTAHQSGLCNGIALNILEKAGKYLGTGVGVVLVLLGRRILDEKPGVSGRGTSPGLSLLRARKGIKLLSLSLRNQTIE